MDGTEAFCWTIYLAALGASWFMVGSCRELSWWLTEWWD
jgi:hypothetical protein